MHFTKMHGLGNDFVIIEGRFVNSHDYRELALRMCDRHGIGYGEYGEGYFRIALTVDKGKIATALRRMHEAIGQVDFPQKK